MRQYKLQRPQSVCDRQACTKHPDHLHKQPACTQRVDTKAGLSLATTTDVPARNRLGEVTWLRSQTCMRAQYHFKPNYPTPGCDAQISGNHCPQLMFALTPGKAAAATPSGARQAR